MKPGQIILFLLCFFLTPLFESCLKERDASKDDVLTLQKRPYLGNELQTIGYYFHWENGHINSIIFLFRNGIYIKTAVNEEDGVDFAHVEKTFFDPNTIETTYSSKFFMGVFNIDSTRIQLNGWVPNAGQPYQGIIWSGLIENDSTFRIEESYRSQNGQKTEYRAENSVYSFHPYAIRPDSNSRFIP